MNSVPLLHVHNHFTCLPVETTNDQEPVSAYMEEIKTMTIDTPPPPEASPLTPLKVCNPRRPKWEKKLLKEYKITSTLSARSLQIPVELVTTDTAQPLGTQALVDSSATGLFIDKDYVVHNKLTMRTLSHPIPVFNVDRMPNECRAITEIVDLVLQYDGHLERALLAVTGLGKQDVILGLSWLEEHNLDINWTTHTVQMTRCPPKCSTCQEKV